MIVWKRKHAFKKYCFGTVLKLVRMTFYVNLWIDRIDLFRIVKNAKCALLSSLSPAFPLPHTARIQPILQVRDCPCHPKPAIPGLSG